MVFCVNDYAYNDQYGTKTMKSAKDFLDEANKTVTRVGTEEAIALHGKGGVFVDVRDSADISKTGTIAGAVRIHRVALLNLPQMRPLHFTTSR